MPHSAEFSVAQIQSLLAPSRLLLRGGFNFGPDDAPPPGQSGAPAKSLLLVGNAGSDYWPVFQTWLRGQSQNLRNPLDTWSREIIGTVALAIGARAVSPADKPYLPFQSWVMRAEGLRASPLGILMHPLYGVWHAYRGALLLDVEIMIQQPRNPIHLCDLCVGKDCLKSCPVGAHSVDGFAYESCLAYVRDTQWQPCRRDGCFDRNACPIASEFRYAPAVQAFHMAAFAA